MAELKTLELDLGPALRKGMIEGLADIVDATPQYRFAVILELLRRDDVSRVMLGEAIGEETLRLHSLCEEASSWDDIALWVLTALQDTPGGRGEVLT